MGICLYWVLLLELDDFMTLITMLIVGLMMYISVILILKDTMGMLF